MLLLRRSDQAQRQDLIGVPAVEVHGLRCVDNAGVRRHCGVLATPIWRIPGGGQPRLPELDRRRVPRRRLDSEVVVPVHVVRELGPEPARRAERLAVVELGLQYPVGRLVDGVVVGAALGRQRPLYAVLMFTKKWSK